MKLEDFDYRLPPELIAQEPPQRRGASRLLVVHREAGSIDHRQFSDFASIPQPGDVVVINNSKVIEARLRGERQADGDRGGGNVELLLLAEVAPQCWRALARPQSRLQPGARLSLAGGKAAAQVERREAGAILVRFDAEVDVGALLEAAGEVPLPPYIRRARGDERLQSLDRERYQTVYAEAPGSIAAPTAGLHFTTDMLRALEARGVAIQQVTLHVGYGTFQPIRCDDVEDHRMHAERCEVSAEAAECINLRRSRGGSIWVIGTTTVRVLETASQSGSAAAFDGAAQLYIYPGFTFNATDHLLTNFHLPKSSLFILVCAMAGRELIMRAYQEAIGAGYRFYSYGDAMLIL